LIAFFFHFASIKNHGLKYRPTPPSPVRF